MTAALRKACGRSALLWTTAGAVLLTGCGFNGLQDVPLPGGAATGDDVYHVTAEFRDVMDLVPQSSVKVNNVTVGAVEEVVLDGWHARVRMRVSDSVKLPDNAVAELRQTSILGEKYVSLAAPADTEPTGRLGDGDTIPITRSDRTPEIEEVLSALSALLNGGGVAQLKTIHQELNHALDGREGRVKALLKELETFMGGLDEQRHEIVRAMEGIDRLSKRLKKEEATVEEALDTIPPALKVLADQRRDLTRMMEALSDLGETGTEVINASREDTVANLRSLRPILQRLNEAGSDLPNSLELLTTYPFPRNVVDSIRGDYVNLSVTADLDLASVYGNLDGYDNDRRSEREPGLPEAPDLPDTPDLPEAPKLPDAPEAPELPCTPGGDCSDGPDRERPDDGGGGALCPPVCGGSAVSYWEGGRLPDGVSPSLVDLMMKGFW